MKTFFALALFFGLSLACHAQTVARYTGTLSVQNTNIPIVFTFEATDRRFDLEVPGSPWYAWGTWTESRAVRSFTILTSTNQFIGKVRRGVVEGTFENYVTGERGTFRCDVPRP